MQCCVLDSWTMRVEGVCVGRGDRLGRGGPRAGVCAGQWVRSSLQLLVFDAFRMLMIYRPTPCPLCYSLRAKGGQRAATLPDAFPFDSAVA